MNTSELINKLIEIDKAVPFDADIVQGDDYEYKELVRVYHSPPNTYLVFESEDDDLEDVFSIAEKLRIRIDHTEEIKQHVMNKDLTKEEIILMLDDMALRMKGMVNDLLRDS